MSLGKAQDGAYGPTTHYDDGSRHPRKKQDKKKGFIKKLTWSMELHHTIGGMTKWNDMYNFGQALETLNTSQKLG